MDTNEDLIYARLVGVPLFCLGRKYYVHKNPIAKHYIITIFSKIHNAEIEIDVRTNPDPLSDSYEYEIFNLDINARDYYRAVFQRLYGDEKHINFILHGIEHGISNDKIL